MKIYRIKIILEPNFRIKNIIIIIIIFFLASWWGFMSNRKGFRVSINTIIKYLCHGFVLESFLWLSIFNGKLWNFTYISARKKLSSKFFFLAVEYKISTSDSPTFLLVSRVVQEKYQLESKVSGPYLITYTTFIGNKMTSRLLTCKFSNRPYDLIMCI